MKTRYLFGVAIPFVLFAPDKEKGGGGADDELDNILDGIADDPADQTTDDGDEPVDGDGDEDAGADGGDGDAAAAAGDAGSRSNSRVRSAVERAQAAERERQNTASLLEQTQRQLADLTSRLNGNGSADNTAAALAEQARLEQMDPIQRLEYQRGRDREEFQRALQISQIQTQDIIDKQTFDSEAARNPVFAKYADRVENGLREMRSKNGNAPRKAILAYLIGLDALQRVEKGTGKAKETSRRRASAAGARPAEGSNQEQQRSRSGDDIASLESRLGKMTI